MINRDEEIKRERRSPDGTPPDTAPNEGGASRVDKLKIKKLGRLGTLSSLLSAGIGVHTFIQSRYEGDNIVTSAAKATADTAVAAAIGPVKYMIGSAVIQGAPAVTRGIQEIQMKAREMERAGSMAPFVGNTFVDNEQIFTMRQASVAMMKQAKYAVEHAMLGNEASFFHR